MDSALLDLKTSKGAALAVACGAVAGAAITFGIQRLRQRKEPAEGAFVLIVRLKLKPGRRVEEFFKLWTPYAAWVHSNEPNTLTYKASVNETAGGALPDTVIIYERYDTTAFPAPNLISQDHCDLHSLFLSCARSRCLQVLRQARPDRGAPAVRPLPPVRAPAEGERHGRGEERRQLLRDVLGLPCAMKGIAVLVA